MPTIGRLRYLEACPQSVSHSSPTTRSRRTLVLIHGFPLNARMWEPQLALAQAGWRVIAPHLRGMDGGATDPETHSIDDYAGDVIDLLDGLHIEEAVIGGLSMGGYVTLGMFRHAPRYFSGMVLADTRAEADTPEGVDGRKRMLALLRDKGVRPLLDEMIPKLLGATTRRDHPDVETRLRQMVSANPDAAIAGAIRALMTRPDSTPLLSSIHCPTLIIVGEEDTLTPPPMSRDLHRAIRSSELAVLPGVGHLSSMEQPQAFNAALESFLTHRV